ncbi:MAG: TPR end-of-group domain-containing protein [Pyrinomonadaceae bacterium]
MEKIRTALSRKPDLDGGYYLLGRALFAAGRYQEVVDIMEEALAHASENYNITIPIHNALGALGKTEALLPPRDCHLRGAIEKRSEDARVRILLAADYASQGRFEEAKREADLAMILRPDDSMILYNTACVFCTMNNVGDAMIAIKKAWEAGFVDPTWTRQDPDLQLLHGDPEFERLYPPPTGEASA